jgi:hypothetical protein
MSQILPQIPNPSIIDQAQAASFVRTVFKVAGTALAYRGISVSPDVANILTGSEAIQFYTGIIMVAVPMVWDWFVHSLSGKIAAVEALPSVAKVLMVPNASPAAMAIVRDSNRPKVDAETPRPPSSLLQRS